MRDLVALSLHCTPPKDTTASGWSAIYAAPDGSTDSGDAMRFGSGTDYTLSWWFANGEQVYTFDSMRAPVVTGANQGGLSATRQTDSTSLIYRFDDSGATELFREDGYRLSNPGANRIGFSSVHYTKGDDGRMNESCAYGTLRYNTADDSYQEYAF